MCFSSRVRYATGLVCLQHLLGGVHLKLILAINVQHVVFLLSTQAPGLSDSCRVNLSLFSAKTLSLSSIRRLNVPLLLFLTLPLTLAVVLHDGQVDRRQVSPELYDAERGQPRLSFADAINGCGLSRSSFSFTLQRSLEARLNGCYQVLAFIV